MKNYSFYSILYATMPADSRIYFFRTKSKRYQAQPPVAPTRPGRKKFNNFYPIALNQPQFQILTNIINKIADKLFYTAHGNFWPQLGIFFALNGDNWAKTLSTANCPSEKGERRSRECWRERRFFHENRCVSYT